MPCCRSAAKWRKSYRGEGLARAFSPFRSDQRPSSFRRDPRDCSWPASATLRESCPSHRHLRVYECTLRICRPKIRIAVNSADSRSGFYGLEIADTRALKFLHISWFKTQIASNGTVGSSALRSMTDRFFGRLAASGVLQPCFGERSARVSSAPGSLRWSSAS
jgi:hypothetical protein